VTTASIDVQIINQGDKPAFAVLPYAEYLALMQSTQKVESTIPHGIVGLCVTRRISLLAAWRIYHGLSQLDLAEMIGVTQPAIAQMERSERRLQQRTLQRLADALRVLPEQLV